MGVVNVRETERKSGVRCECEYSLAWNAPQVCFCRVSIVENFTPPGAATEHNPLAPSRNFQSNLKFWSRVSSNSSLLRNATARQTHSTEIKY